MSDDRVDALHASRWQPTASTPTAAAIRVRARTFVVAGGAINYAGAAAAQRRARSARARGQAHVPAPDGGVGGAHAGAHRRPFAGAPQTVYSATSSSSAAPRRPGRLQARGAAGTSDPRRDHAARLTAARTRNGCSSCRELHVLIALLRDGFHERRARWRRAPARRRLAGARLSADALPVGRRAARDARRWRSCSSPPAPHA